VSDIAGNPQTATATVYVTTSDTCKPTIGTPYYYTACIVSPWAPINNGTFDKDVTIFWSHSDYSGGSCRDSGINKATGRVEITGPNDYYEDLTPGATIKEGSGQVVFPVSRLVIGEYTIKISVSDVAGNTQTVTATVYVKDYPPTTPTITFSKNPVLPGEEFTVTAHSTDPDGDSITYWWRWQYPCETEPGAPWSSVVPTLGPISVSEPGNHIVYCRAEDEHGALSERGSATLTVNVTSRNFYLSALHGNDETGLGTVESPWKTPYKIESLSCTLRPGDRILFARGETWSIDTIGTIPQMHIATASGDASSCIVFGSYGSGAPPIIDFGPTDSGAIEYGWKFVETDYITIENIDFRGGYHEYLQIYNTDCKWGVLTFEGKTDHIQLLDLHFKNTAIGSAILFQQIPNTPTGDWIFRDDIAIQRCSLINDKNEIFGEIYRRSGFSICNANGFTIEDCVTTNAGFTGIGLYGWSQYGLIRRNIIKDSIACGIAAGMSADNTIEWNVIVDNGKDSYAYPPFNDPNIEDCNVEYTDWGEGKPHFYNPNALDLTFVIRYVIRYNVIARQHNPCKARWETCAIYFEGWCQDNKVYGNIMYKNGGSCMMSGNNKDIYFFNNLCYDNLQAYNDPDTITHEDIDVAINGNMCTDDGYGNICGIKRNPDGSPKLDEHGQFIPIPNCECPEINTDNVYLVDIGETEEKPASNLIGHLETSGIVANNIVVNATKPNTADYNLAGLRDNRVVNATFANNLYWDLKSGGLDGPRFLLGWYTLGPDCLSGRTDFAGWNGYTCTNSVTGATRTVINEFKANPRLPDLEDPNHLNFVPLADSPCIDAGNYQDSVIGTGDFAQLLDAAAMNIFDMDDVNVITDVFNTFALRNNFVDNSYGPPDIGPFVQQRYFAGEELVDLYPHCNYDTYANLGTSTQGRGQAITLTNDSDISRILIFLKRVNNPDGSLKAAIQPATGTVGTNAVPTGNPLAESNEVLCSSVPADDFGLVSFVFDPPYSVPAGDITFYLDTSGATFNEGDAIYFGCDSTGTHAGNYLGTTDGGTTWFSNSSMDAIFYLYESQSPF
jgi:hypothetical protein